MENKDQPGFWAAVPDAPGSQVPSPSPEPPAPAPGVPGNTPSTAPVPPAVPGQPTSPPELDPEITPPPDTRRPWERWADDHGVRRIDPAAQQSTFWTTEPGAEGVPPDEWESSPDNGFQPHPSEFWVYDPGFDPFS